MTLPLLTDHFTLSIFSTDAEKNACGSCEACQ